MCDYGRANLGVKASAARHGSVPSALAETKQKQPQEVLDDGAFQGWNAPYNYGAADPGPCAAKSYEVPALRCRFGGDDKLGVCTKPPQTLNKIPQMDSRPAWSSSSKAASSVESTSNTAARAPVAS